MFGVSVLLAVLALAGAPSSTPVTCNPNIGGAVPGSTVYGLTYWQGARPVRSELGALACRAIVYSAATPKERAAIRRLNPGIDWPSTQGGGLLVALHESTHVALQSRDECVVERTAFAKIDTLIAQYVPKADVSRAKASAIVLDAQERGGSGCA